MKFQFLIGLFLVFTVKTLSQENQFSIGSHIPMYYTAGYEEKVFGKWFLNFQFGWLDKPYDKVLIDQAKKKGLNETIADVTYDGFKTGYCFQPAIKYRFKYFYVSAFYSHGIINSQDLDYKVLANYYGIDIPETVDIPELGFSMPFPDIQADSKSILYNGGITIGTEFRFKNPGFAIGVELSYTKIFNTKNELIVDRYSELIPPEVHEDFQKELNKFYTDEGDIPTLNIFLIYRFGRSINGLISKI